MSRPSALIEISSSCTHWVGLVIELSATRTTTSFSGFFSRQSSLCSSRSIIGHHMTRIEILKSFFEDYLQAFAQVSANLKRFQHMKFIEGSLWFFGITLKCSFEFLTNSINVPGFLKDSWNFVNIFFWRWLMMPFFQSSCDWAQVFVMLFFCPNSWRLNAL